MSATITVSIEDLTALVARVLETHGLAPDATGIIASLVVAAERDGVKSHGLVRLPGYASTMKSGYMNPRAVPKVRDAAPGVVAVDGDNGFAQIALAACRERLMAKARAQGIAMAALHNTHHFSSLYLDVEPMAEAGFVALTCVNTRSLIAPGPGARKVLGTSPMGFACPRAGGPPIVWDQASSVRSFGDVMIAARRGERLPEGIAFDKEGKRTTDPKAVLDDGAILSFGGYKGHNIALMIEVLAAALTGGRLGYEDVSKQFPGAETSHAGQFMMLIDPAHTAGEGFAERTAMIYERLHASGAERVPGDRRHAQRETSLREGITVDAGLYEAAQALLVRR
ncbi:MAG: Ldh family oxidoreductase [Alphaproteobacteria bacterium]